MEILHVVNELSWPVAVTRNTNVSELILYGSFLVADKKKKFFYFVKFQKSCQSSLVLQQK